MQLRIAGRNVGYEDAGADGDGGTSPLVLLHPFPFDRRFWSATVEALGGARRVIAIDARGFGESDLGGWFSIADLADDLAALLDALRVAGKVTVLGLSMGGYVALAFAQRHAARLRALILADTRAAADSPEARQGREQAIAMVRTEGIGPYLERSLPRLLAPPDARLLDQCLTKDE